MSQSEQRANMKFCFKLGKTATETHNMLSRVYGDEAVSKITVFRWFERFRKGNESLKDEARSGRPSTSRSEDNIAQIKALIHADRRLTIREIVEETNLSFGSVQAILTVDLQMRRIAAKFVPRILTDDQKEHRVISSTSLIDRCASDPTFLSKVITGDETWVYGYDPETKRQSSQWKTPMSPRPKKARQSRSQAKVMLLAFFDMEGIVHTEFLPRGTTVNAAFYLEVLKRLREAVRRKRREKWNGGWLLHHDNAPSHAALVTQQFLAEKKIPLVPHPPYSPDLAPCDFWLFPKLKLVMKGHRFDTIEDIQSETTSVLKSIKKAEFQRCFHQWQERWNKCVDAGGEYFEGDN